MKLTAQVAAEAILNDSTGFDLNVVETVLLDAEKLGVDEMYLDGLRSIKDDFEYETYARWAVGPIMSRAEWDVRQARIRQAADNGTLGTNPYAW